MRRGSSSTTHARFLRRSVAVVAAVVSLAACSSATSGSGGPTSSVTTSDQQTAVSSSQTSSGQSEASNTQPTVGQGTTSGSALLAEAAAAVQKSTEPLSWTAPGPAIDVSSLRGKSVALIVVSGSEFGKSVAAGMQQAADQVGIKFTPYFGDGTLATARTQIANAVTSGVSGIVLESYDPTALRDSLSNAKANGAKIVAFGQYDFGAVPDAAKAAGVDALVGTCYKCAGVLMADALAVDSDGKADALFANVPEIGVANLIKDGFDAELARVCPDCKVTTIDSSTGNMKTQLPQAVSSALVKDPDINYIVPVFDVYAAIFASSIAAAGVADRVKLLGADASRAPLQEMQQGAQPTWIYNVGFNPQEMGWTSLDQLMRVMLGQPTNSENVASNRGFTPDTVKGLDINKYPDAWFSSEPDYYSAGFAKLWTH